MLRKCVPFVLCLLASVLVSSAAPAPDNTRVATDIATIPVMIVYDQSAVDLFGSVLAVQDEIAKMVDEDFNGAAQDSGVLVKLQLVHVGIMPAGTYKASSLAAKEPEKAILADIKLSGALANLRSKYKASIVCLFTDKVFVGAAGQPRTKGALYEPGNGYCVIPASSARPSLVGAHEFGHLLAAGHQVVPKLKRGKDIFPNARGYVSSVSLSDSGKVCDLMSTGCDRVPVFSGPGVVYEGITLGDAKHNNAAAMNASRWYVLDWAGMKYKPAKAKE